MSNKIIIKHGNSKPEKGVLNVAELGWDTMNKLLYVGNGNSEPIQLPSLGQGNNFSYRNYFMDMPMDTQTARDERLFPGLIPLALSSQGYAGQNECWIGFYNEGFEKAPLGYIGYKSDGQPYASEYIDKDTKRDYKIIHSGNYGEYSIIKPLPIKETRVNGPQTHYYIDLEELENEIVYGLPSELTKHGKKSTRINYCIYCDDGTIMAIASGQSYTAIRVNKSNSLITLQYVFPNTNASYRIDISDKSSVDKVIVMTSNNTYYLGINNSDEYTPIYEYSPATKKYVDDAVKNAVENVYIIQSSSENSSKKFKLTVDDTGTITATEVT